MKEFKGKVLFLDKSNINTDDIIPAKYLTENTKAALKPYLLEDLNREGFDPKKDIAGKAVIITRANFGCGSSREHAPWALEMNNINLVIAESFARIFRQNMFNCGMMAIELPEEKIGYLFTTYAGKEIGLEVDVKRNVFIITGSGKTEEIGYKISEFDQALVEANGWVDYADARY